RRKQPDDRPAKRLCVAERLPFAGHAVGTEFAWWLQQAERGWVGRDNEVTTNAVSLLGERCNIPDRAEGVRMLHDEAGEVVIKILVEFRCVRRQSVSWNWQLDDL